MRYWRNVSVIQQTKPKFRTIYQAIVIEITIIDYLFNGLNQNNDVTLICSYPKYDNVPFTGNVTLFATDEFPKHHLNDESP
ncbi:MAG: hypothetical protein PHN45_07780 [Methylococcales bacterium]|nr:hypothetical protein [Methylococcales bacterium]MDD5754635.1 hypothetical protein [Methylococcales bacterium]